MQVAERLGVHRATVQKYVKKFSIKTRSNREMQLLLARSKYDVTKEQLQALYDEGLSIKNVAARLGIPQGTMDSYFKKLDVKTRTRTEAARARRKTSPPKATLEYLYIIQDKSSRDIAKIFNTNKTQVLRWLKRSNIRIKTDTIIKYPDRPNKTELEHMLLTEHLTYAQVAERYGCDPSLPYHWAKRLGISLDNKLTRVWSQRLAQRGFIEPTEKELRELYITQGLSSPTVGEILGCGQDLIRSRLRHFNIPIRPRGYLGARRLTCKAGIRVSSGYECSVANWLTDHNLVFIYEPTISTRPTRRADFLVKDHYIEVWGLMGKSWYEARRLQKLEIYRQKGFALIEIFPRDIPKHLDAKLSILSQ